MQTMAQVLRIEIWCLLIGLATIVAYRMLTGDIITKGLLQDKGGSSGFSPARLQLFISTLVVACYYAGNALTSANTGRFPTIPNEMLLILGGSHTFYLGSKTVALILENFGLSKTKAKKRKGD